jgi:hypothetical protein
MLRLAEAAGYCGDPPAGFKRNVRSNQLASPMAISAGTGICLTDGSTVCRIMLQLQTKILLAGFDDPHPRSRF